MNIKNIVIAGSFLVWGINSASAQQTGLSFNPEKGAKYEYHTEMTQSVKQTVMGQEMPVVVEMSTKCLMEIMDKTTQEITVQYTYREMTYNISNPMMKMEYDSKKPIETLSGMNQMLGKMLGVMIGQSVTAVYAPDGSVKSFSGMETINKNMINAIADSGPEGMQTGELMRQQFTDDAMKNAFEQSFKIYPANPVNVGAGWNMENVATVNNMKTSSKTRYTLNEVKNGVAFVAVDGEMEMNPGAGMGGKITGTHTGTITIDTKTGIPLTNEILQNAKGSIIAQGMDIPTEIVSKFKTSINGKEN